MLRRGALLAASGSLGYGNWLGNYSNVSLLLRNGSQAFINPPVDESSSPKTISAVDSATISSAVKKYGSSSFYLPGNSVFTASSSTAFNFGTADFTLETWFQPLSLSGSQTIAAYGALSGGPDFSLVGWTLDYIGNTEIRFTLSTSSGSNGFLYANKTVALSLGQWYHVAVSRQSGVVRVFVDGVPGTSNTIAVAHNNPASPFLSIGRYFNLAGYFQFLNGYLDDFRVTKNVARYVSTFTPPTAELPANATGDASYSNVSVLLRNGTAGPLAPLDESPSPKTITALGNASISTSVYKWGNGSLSFDGNGDQFTAANVNANNADLTIECWLKLNAYPSSSAIIACTYSGTTTGTQLNTFILYVDSTGRVSAGGALGGASTTTTIPLNTWAHVAFVYTHSNQTRRAFLSGVPGSSYSSESLSNTSVTSVFIGGSSGASNIGTWWLNGYIDDLRITKGVARYTKNFLPPPAELPNF